MVSTILTLIFLDTIIYYNLVETQCYLEEVQMDKHLSLLLVLMTRLPHTFVYGI